MKTQVIVHRSLLRGTLMILAALSLLAVILPLRAEAGVRVAAQVGPVAIDYRDRGPGYDAQAHVAIAPDAGCVVVGRPVCGGDLPGCAVVVLDRCARHDRDRDGRCDQCERRERRERRRDDRRDDRRYGDERSACGERGHGYDRDHDAGCLATGRDRGDRCDHSRRCESCTWVKMGTCRDHAGLVWVEGRWDRTIGRHGHGNRVWIAGHWTSREVACR